jgi:PASTA domain
VYQKIGETSGSYDVTSTPVAVTNLGSGETGWMHYQQWSTPAGGTFYWRECYDPGTLNVGPVYCGAEQKFSTPNPNNVTLPDTTIPTGPPATTTLKTADFTLQSTIPNATFECSLDGAAFKGCPDGVAIKPGPHYANLAVGAHTFRARAKDPQGHLDATPASRSWTVQAVPPPPPPPPPPPVTKCHVPKVVGKTLARAKTKIRAAHCSVGRVTKVRSQKKKGTVVKQRPAAGKTLAAGSKVRLWVSRGRR